MTRIAIIPNVSGVGGMVSFWGRISSGLEKCGFETTSLIQPEDADLKGILVIGGTKDIPALWRAKLKKKRVVQRLNGLNWMHRRMKTGVRHFLRAEYGNLILNFIRLRIADHIVYQSNFVKGWWEKSRGESRVTSSVVYNGVDLNLFTPEVNTGIEEYKRPEDRYRVLMVEGNLGGGYEVGIKTAVQLVRHLNTTSNTTIKKPVELVIAGKLSEKMMTEWSGITDIQLTFTGLVNPKNIPSLDRSAHFLFSADINAACPNSVIESLACGTPALGFDTGGLPELIINTSGEVVPYGGNPWRLDPPDVKSLAAGGAKILKHLGEYQTGARTRAVEAFGVDRMVDEYLRAFDL